MAKPRELFIPRKIQPSKGRRHFLTSSKMMIGWWHKLSLWRNRLPLLMFGNTMVSFNICSISIILSDERSSFDLKYDDDDDVRRHWIKNDAVMTIKPSPLMTPPLDIRTVTSLLPCSNTKAIWVVDEGQLFSLWLSCEWNIHF